MARTRTLAQLRTEVYQRADLVGATVSFPATEIDRYINQSIAELWDIVRAHGPDDHFVQSSTLTFTANDPDATLPTDFYQAVAVERVQGGRLIPMRRVERGNTPIRQTDATGLPRTYRIQSSVVEATGARTQALVVYPTPGSAVDIQLTYVPHAPVLVDDADTWDGFNGWEEYVVLDAALKCMEREQNPDTGPMLARRERVKDRIVEMVANLDQYRNDRIVDVYDSPSSWWDDLYPPRVW